MKKRSGLSLEDKLVAITASRVTQIGRNLFYIVGSEATSLGLCVSAVPPPPPSKVHDAAQAERGQSAEIRYHKRGRVVELIARDAAGDEIAQVELRLGDFLHMLGVSADECSLQ